MGTATLRPNSTIQAGTGITLGGGAASASAALGDNSDTTYVQTSTYQSSVWGDTAPATAVPVVAFADATGTVPAGRTITSVQFFIRAKCGVSGSTSPGSSSLRYSDNVEATFLSMDVTGGTVKTYSTTLNTAQTSSGGNKGSWTYALVDGLKAAVGQDGTTGTSQTMDLWLVVNYTDQPATPTNVTPASGASVTTDTPNLTATMSGTGAGSGFTIEWQLATDSGFTANVRTVTSTGSASNGVWTQAVPSGSALSPGTWYIRARAKDQLNTYSAYSTGTSFTVSHPASATSLSPTGGATQAYVSPKRLSWTFTDTSATDTQSAYQVILERNDTGQVITDTGKLTSTNKYHDMTITTTYKSTMLRWKVQVWDDNNTSAGYSAYSLFMLADTATIAITAPTAGQVVANGAPTTTWTVGGAATQVKYKVDYKLASNGTVVHSSGTITDANTRSYTPSTNVLQNTTNYQVTVSVTDSNGLVGTATQSFSTNYPTPSAVTSSADNTNLVSTGYINVDWSQQTADASFVQWNVYRRLMGTTTWTRIYSTTSVNTRNYHDWTFPAGNLVEYSVTQTALRSGVNVEGAPDSNPADIDTTDGNYWLINPYDESVNMLLDNVVDDSFTDEYEQESFVIIGRGRKVNYGTRAGYTGSITCKFRDDLNRTARQKRLQLELLKATRNLYYLRNPFGDVMQVALGNIQIGRIAGVGSSEFCDVQIPYEQVF